MSKSTMNISWKNYIASEPLEGLYWLVVQEYVDNEIEGEVSSFYDDPTVILTDIETIRGDHLIYAVDQGVYLQSDDKVICYSKCVIPELPTFED